MWQRTKRLINSYLDDLISRASSPDREAREVTRGELARLGELEIQTRASAKMLEKELAEVDLKILGIAERERMARERGDLALATEAGRQLLNLDAERNQIKQQLSEANSAAERARSLREDRRRTGEDLAMETHLTSMRESLSSIQSPFDSTDPAATLEEMRGRIRAGGGSIDNRVADADRELEAERARARVEEMLSRYKQRAVESEPVIPAQRTHAGVVPDTAPASKPSTSTDGESAGESKTLGRTEGPVRPID
jgi:hypothetical protein